MKFGTKGNIPLFSAKELFKDVDPSIVQQFDRIPYYMLNDPRYFGNSEVWQVYQQYSAAISRKSGRSDVGFDIFMEKIMHNWMGSPIMCYANNGNYLLGIVKSGVFICVYFAPKSVGIGMFKFIQEICEFDNVVFAVTDDMADMLERLGCPKHNEAVNAKFRGQMHEKMVYGSTQDAAEKGAKLLNLMGKSGELGGVLASALQNNPKLKELYDNDPQIVYKLINEPIITQCLMNNPQLVDFINSNPDIMNQISADPLRGFLNFLMNYKKNKKAATMGVNESKKKIK
jgi:hypothetical protein